MVAILEVSILIFFLFLLLSYFYTKYCLHLAVVFIGSILFALQQLSGINAIFYFSSSVFRTAGVPSDVANICVGLANLSGLSGSMPLFFTSIMYFSASGKAFFFNMPVSGSIFAMVLMDKLGRRLLLLGSFMAMVSFKYL